tara:strand:+ start:211 stop:384 length:174 start_codon:yes stop_codon:yes gene_type:complete
MAVAPTWERNPPSSASGGSAAASTEYHSRSTATTDSNTLSLALAHAPQIIAVRTPSD